MKEAYGLKNVVRFDRVPGTTPPTAPNRKSASSRKPRPTTVIIPSSCSRRSTRERTARSLPRVQRRADPDGCDVVIVREISVETGETVLAETITLIEHESIGTWAAHSAQEITADGKLGGVRRWRSAHTSCAMPNEGKKGK